MELSGGDNFGELFHVCWLNINNVEALVLDVEIPQVDPQVVTADKRFTIAVDRYAVDVIGVRICVGLPGYGCNYGIVVSEAG